MKAIYTYWTDGKDVSALNGGFNNLRDMAAMVTLSIRKLKEQNPQIISVHLVTNTIGKQLFADKYPVPFDQVDVILDELDGVLSPNHWAFAKIMAYAAQTEPFIHIDCDVILWEPLSEELTSKDLFFQNKEDLSTHQGYHVTMDNAKTVLPIDFDYKVKWAYNCGIVGSKRPDIMQKWLAMAKDYLFNPKNEAYWHWCKDKHSTNHLFEQYFISTLVKHEGIECGELLPNFTYDIDQTAITHLWGPVKRDAAIIEQVYSKLERTYPDDYATLMQVKVDHKDVFTTIYKQRHWGEGSGGGSAIEVTQEYRDLLSKFIKDKAITSVVDLGCGYWAFNDYVEWNGANYIGIDVVDAVQDYNRLNVKQPNCKFITDNILTCKIPKCDLLIIKDVMIHWTNAEVQTFFKRKINAKYILITNDDRVTDVNTDIVAPGQYRDIDVTKIPFNIAAEVIMKWDSQHKSTWLILN